jgi:hypothetical protein
MQDVNTCPAMFDSHTETLCISGDPEFQDFSVEVTSSFIPVHFNRQQSYAYDNLLGVISNLSGIKELRTVNAIIPETLASHMFTPLTKLVLENVWRFVDMPE